MRIHGGRSLARIAWVASVRCPRAFAKHEIGELGVGDICERCPRTFLEDEVGWFEMRCNCEGCPPVYVVDEVGTLA